MRSGLPRKGMKAPPSHCMHPNLQTSSLNSVSRHQETQNFWKFGLKFALQSIYRHILMTFKTKENMICDQGTRVGMTATHCSIISIFNVASVECLFPHSESFSGEELNLKPSTQSSSPALSLSWGYLQSLLRDPPRHLQPHLLPALSSPDSGVTSSTQTGIVSFCCCLHRRESES